MKFLKILLGFVFFLFLGVGGVVFHLKNGYPLSAALWSLPLAAIILAFLFPGKGPGHFALTYEFGPVREEGESERQYHFKMAKWWAVGSLIFPIGTILSFLFEDYQGFSVVAMFGAFLLGIPCFLKCIGSLYRAAKSKS